MLNRALLVLECPWGTPEDNPKRASVLVFLHGLEKLMGNFNVYYSIFYEREGFRRALLNDLIHTRENRQFLYISAHGSQRMVGRPDEHTGMQLNTLLESVYSAAENSNIEGVVLGSCKIGVNVGDLEFLIATSKIVWIFGYTCNVDWLTSMLIDICIFENLMTIGPKDLGSRDKILLSFARALARFEGRYELGWDENGDDVDLRDAFTLIIQPKGKGKKPRDETEALREMLGWAEEM